MVGGWMDGSASLVATVGGWVSGDGGHRWACYEFPS